MVRPRWRKVWRDLWVHKTRTALAVVSIMIGIFAIGMTAGSRQVLSRDLSASYAAINPASANVQTLVPFDEGVVDVVRNIPGIRDAQGRTNLMVRMKAGDDEWRNLQLIAVPDYADVRIDKILPDTGAWPPPNRAVLVERSAQSLIGVSVGDDILIKMPGRKARSLHVAGTAHDLYALIYTFDGLPWAFVTQDTLEWLGAGPGFTEMHVVVEPELAHDREAVAIIARKVSDKIERAKSPVFLTSLPEPGKHPLDSIIQSLLLVLGAIGVLSLVLGALLVTSTISALLAEETRAIGVMKTIGARTRQLTAMYTALVLLYGILALSVGVPAGYLGSRLLAAWLADFLNFDLHGSGFSGTAVVLQLAVGLIVPVVAALVPIVRGTRVSVREAISDYGLGKGQFGTGRFDHLLERVRGLSRPLLLALRNTFRRKARLALTLTTLTAGTALYISIFNVRLAAVSTMEAIMKLVEYDVFVELSQPARVEHLEREAKALPGVDLAEAWGWGTASWPEEDGAPGIYFGYAMPVMVWAPPADTQMLNPTLVEGRWLLPEDENALVINTKVRADRPEAHVGGQLTLTMAGRDQTWQVVGVVRDIGLVPMVYANYPYYARVMRQAGRASTMAVTLDADSTSSVAQAERALEERLEQAGLKVSMLSAAEDEAAEAEAMFDAVLALLVVMAALVAVVGGLSLMGAMSLSVIERTREIGVMRAIGAANRSIFTVFVGEGVLIGLLSWALGALVSVPIGKLLSDAVGIAMLDAPLVYSFSWSGALIWLAAVLVISVGASLVPAWNAARVSVRESLAYE